MPLTRHPPWSASLSAPLHLTVRETNSFLASCTSCWCERNILQRRFHLDVIEHAPSWVSALRCLES